MPSCLTNAVEIFYSYSHLDEELRCELVKHLANLEHQGVIKGWHDRKITAGTEWAGKIDEHLNSAQIILLLISSDFMASPYCNDVEVKRAMERHEAGEARVIPVILRPCDWEGAPFSKLQALPTDAKAVTLSSNRDEAFLDIVKGIRKVVQDLAVPPPSVHDPVLRPPCIGFVERVDKHGRNIVNHLIEALAPGRNSIVTLTGPGGVGKTTLATQAALTLREAYGGRVVWSVAEERADYTDGSLFDDIAAQLGNPHPPTLPHDDKAARVRAII
ncbi:MAG TPA: TIR domain-containing protein, partial [Pyrinomonadaceae bacterium]|nr:TIR domain-containing protein [Pyrinomonadaceae bacterium]